MQGRIPTVLKQFEHELLDDWIREQLATSPRREVMKEGELRQQCTEFLRLLQEAVATSGSVDLAERAWAPLLEMLANLSRSRGRQGFSPSQTATFVFSFKRPLFERLRKEIQDPEQLFAETWAATQMIDKLGLYTTEVHQKARDEIITRQQEEMLELSTPVVKLWDGIVAVPLIGTLDSARTQVVMENLLQTIVDTSSRVAIIDITGVPTVDTLVAQHLLKTVAAAKLMGAQCIISGIRPQIAQTIVHLSLDLGDVATKGTLADAFQLALARTGQRVNRRGGLAEVERDGGSLARKRTESDS